MKYLSELISQNKKLFETDDLAVLWNISSKPTLLTTIARYVKKGVLFKVRKGLYSVVPLSKLDKYELGCAYVSGFCYLSLQTVLFEEGYINQSPGKITLVGERSLGFEVAGIEYICRKMERKKLYNLNGINLSGKYPKATVARAIADTIYYNKKAHFDKSLVSKSEEIQFINMEVFK